jgi:hypothetical protein
MDGHYSSSERRCWLLRSMALTVALGATLLAFSAQRPGYLGFALISTFGFFLAGLLWTGGSSSGGTRRPVSTPPRPVSAPPRLSTTAAGLRPTVLVRARAYRVRGARSAGHAAA